MLYRCCDDLRREAVKAQSARNAIDYLEVVDHDEPDPAKRQRVLRVYFVNAPPPAVGKENVRVDGGERIKPINVVDAVFDGDVLVVTVDPRGDFSPYVLRLVETNGDPLHALDPQLAEIEFSFKVECASDFDCAPQSLCREPVPHAPRIDYLAKDYESFRRLMLDRMSLLVPSWRERNTADLGIALVEALAYVADHLSYEQDAVATEAYLATARRRTSVRRHARLVDYRMHDGCNARVFVQVEVTADLTLPAGTTLLTKVENFDIRLPPAKLDAAVIAGATVFETMHSADLFADHDTLHFYTWGSKECCLARAATAATLAGAHPNLHEGQLLVFEEVIGPQTGNAADADPRHRCVVRLTSALVGEDPVRKVPATPIPITEITWDAVDALPFALCITANIDGDETEVSVAHGNVVLADHGRTVSLEDLGKMPAPDIFQPPQAGDACDRAQAVAVPVRFRPRLANGPLTQQGRIAVPTTDVSQPAAFDPSAPAASAMAWDMPLVLPRIELRALGTAVFDWDVRADLFSSDETSRHFVAEVEEDGIATIRFGDDEYGAAPLIDTGFKATYRYGNGAAGNVGAGAIAHIITTDGGIAGVRNPLAARGGVDPEPIDHAREAAPAAFRVQERAVTESDYAAVTERHTGVDRAAATYRWTGSWYTVFDTIDRSGGKDVDDPYRTEIRDFVERYRVVGNDLEVDAPRFVSLDVAMQVCVKPLFFRGDVEAELLDLFSSSVRRDGSPGFFHPDNFTFGQPVYLSRLYAAAQGVQGVDSVSITRFERQGNALTSGIDAGELTMARLEIARLENSRDFPERGRLSIELRGGR